MSRIGEPGFSYVDPIAVGAIISQIFPFIVLFSRIDLQQRCQPPPVSAHPVCCDRSRGTPRHEDTGGCIHESVGGSIHPRTPMLKRTTHATAHSKALQMHKALPKMTESASPAATNVVARPDPARRGTRQALTHPHQMERLRRNGSAKLPPLLYSEISRYLATVQEHSTFST